ncbi:MAG: LexA family protein [Halanaerobiales bacterium]
MFDKKQFKNLLEKAIDDKTITQFSKESGVNRTYLSKYLNLKLDTAPNPDILEKIANNSENITYEELMTAAGYLNERLKSMLFTRTMNNPEWSKLHKKYLDIYSKNDNNQNTANTIPIIKEINSKSILSSSNIIDYMVYHGNYNNDNLFAIQIKDNSLDDMGIHEGDFLVINLLDRDPAPGKTVCLLIDENVTIKRYYPIDGKINLEPSNTNKKSYNKEDINIIGEVVFLQRKF